MAKGQKRSGREAKKPKKEVPKISTAAGSSLQSPFANPSKSDHRAKKR
ncbi:MAG: hypothetical protein ACOYLQ_10835 [Hyphomicrobiaceae bacterium]|jgi:hypothetical protein